MDTFVLVLTTQGGTTVNMFFFISVTFNREQREEKLMKCITSHLF